MGAARKDKEIKVSPGTGIDRGRFGTEGTFGTGSEEDPTRRAVQQAYRESTSDMSNLVSAIWYFAAIALAFVGIAPFVWAGTWLQISPTGYLAIVATGVWGVFCLCLSIFVVFTAGVRRGGK